MRCSDAVAFALLTNARFESIEWARKMAFAAAKRSLSRKEDDCYLVGILSQAEAKEILLPELPRIIKTQNSSGGWKKKDTARISLEYLRILKHSDLLKGILSQFKHDPIILFKDLDDYYGIVARREIFNKPNPNDDQLIERQLSDAQRQQRTNGSWEDTVLSTVCRVERLVDMGIAPGNKTIMSAAEFILSSMQENVLRLSNNHGNVLVAHNMLTNPNRSEEFLSAKKCKPEWDPKQACYNHLPMVQTGYAIWCLNRIGFAKDKRVIAACQNFVDIYEKYGGWCDSNIRNGAINGIFEKA